MREWDPIGVADVPEAADEYDTYIPGIFALLRNGTNAKELTAYLDGIALDRMGLTPNRRRSSAAAFALLTMWASAAR